MTDSYALYEIVVFDQLPLVLESVAFGKVSHNVPLYQVLLDSFC